MTTRLYSQLKIGLPRLALATGAPFLLALTPSFAFNNYTYSLLNLALIYILVAIGLNLLTGYAGLISLGHSGLLAVGAYTTAALHSLAGLPYILSLAAAGLLTGLVGALLAIPALRLSGPYLALVTVGFTVAVPQILVLLNFRTDGLEGLKITQPNLPGFEAGNDLARYYLFMPLVFLLYLLAENLTRSPIGRAWLALRESERAAQVCGISLARYKVLAFVVSAIYTGLAGGLYAGQVGRVTATDFNLLQSILFLVMLTVGGLGSGGGVVAGALLLTFLPELVNRLSNLSQDFLNGIGINLQLKNPQYVLYGGLILICVLFLPEGLAGLVRKYFPSKAKLSAEIPSASQIPIAATLQVAPPATLQLSEITVRFGGLTALDKVSLQVLPGQIVGLIGPNGAGKTTVFNCLSRFCHPDAGQLLWQSRDLTHLPPHKIVELGIARTFQNLELFKKLSVLDNLLIGQHSRLNLAFLAALFHWPTLRQTEAVARQRAFEIMHFLNLTNLASTPVSTLSYGQQKLVELGRALVAVPRLLLLDEPAAGLNEAETASLADLLRRIRNKFDITILLVEHDMALVMPLCDQLYVLDFGKLLAAGTPLEIQQNELVIAAYLGREA